MLISIIIPSYNSEKTIERNIKSLLKQDYEGKYEIIVVDKSTDKTPEIVSKFPVKLIKQKSKGISAARNLGVKKAKGKIVAFIDSDCIAPKDWLTNLLKPFSEKDVVAVGGTYKTKNKESIVARFTGYEIEQRHERMKNLETIDFVGGFNCAYRKGIFLKSGGFNTSFAQSEDGELSYRISKTGKIKFNPSAYVYHYHPDSLTKFLEQRFWHAYWRTLVYRKHKDKALGDSYTSKSVFILKVLIPLSLLSGLSYLIYGLAFLADVFLLVGFILIAISFLLTIPTSRKIFVKDKTVGTLSPFIMISRDFVMDLGIIYGLIRSK